MEFSVLYDFTKQFAIEHDGSGRVIIARNGVGDVLWIGIGISDGNRGYVTSGQLCHCHNALRSAQDYREVGITRGPKEFVGVGEDALAPQWRHKELSTVPRRLLNQAVKLAPLVHKQNDSVAVGDAGGNIEGPSEVL